MQIYVDADACPKVIKDILFRCAERAKVTTILVANKSLMVPKSAFIKTKRVEHGFDEADNYIVEQLEAGDIVITADIPLAADAVKKGALVISPKGILFDENNIQQRLSMRNFMEELRSSGEQIGGPAAFNQTDRRNFANQLDRLIQKATKK